MYKMSHKNQKTIWELCRRLLLDLEITRSSVLSHFNSAKVVHTAVSSLFLYAGCTPKVSGNDDEMLGRLSTTRTTK